MKRFLSVRALVDWCCGKATQGYDSEKLKQIIEEKRELIHLLELLEEVNPCKQEYLVHKDIILISYQCELNLLSFGKNKRLKVRTRIIGMPLSISQSGIWVCGEQDISVQNKVLEALDNLKGLTVVLNSDIGFPGQDKTLSNFVFRNRFTSFAQYLDEMRSSYRRQHTMAMLKGENLSFHMISPTYFKAEHYQLYQSIMKRSEYPLEILSEDFFRGYQAEIFEVRDSEGQLLAFVQMKGIGDTLHFMFCGFERDREGNSAVLYHNMLLSIIRYGIEKGYKTINLGQTSEEAKLKLGCVEEKKYLYIRHSNSFVDSILRKLSGRFSYRGYPVDHRVFKENEGLNGRAGMNENFSKKSQSEDVILPP